jgi:hypothetical protein
MPKAPLKIPVIPSTVAGVVSGALTLRSNIATLLQDWSSDEVEEAAWEFALVGWQRPLALSRDYDLAFSAYVQLFEVAGNPGPGSAFFALDAVRHILEELRNRVQFIQTRAADIRLSHQFSRLLEATSERLMPLIDSLLKEADRRTAEEREVLVTEFSERHGSLLRTFADALGRYSGKVGATVHLAADHLDQASRAVAEMERLGVVGNAVYDSLKLIAGLAIAHAS